MQTTGAIDEEDPMILEITSDEREQLQKLLEATLTEARVEIRRTSTPHYHDRLVEERDRLDVLLDKIRSAH